MKWRNLNEAVTKAFGDADIVVNNAVIQYKWVSVLVSRRRIMRASFGLA